MAAAESMCTGESDNFLVIETGKKRLMNERLKIISSHVPHAVKDASKVVRALSSIRETSIRCSLGSETVNATRAPGNLGASHFLYEKKVRKVYLAAD